MLLSPSLASAFTCSLARLLALSFISCCQCHSEETTEAFGPFYLVTMSGSPVYAKEVKDPTQGVTVCNLFVGKDSGQVEEQLE